MWIVQKVKNIYNRFSNAVFSLVVGRKYRNLVRMYLEMQKTLIKLQCRLWTLNNRNQSMISLSKNSIISDVMDLLQLVSKNINYKIRKYYLQMVKRIQTTQWRYWGQELLARFSRCTNLKGRKSSNSRWSRLCTNFLY